ncbi:hypothetical protein FRE64_12515 [Euhalothece natronophila Z-M001]|uniref:Uncharacterized protein n=1 Tax=Euhalothece natronophila Z-M001 TaxID=522448 RepID=A0A5B8NN29_9CHRO|nr:hypothetical protein [Euhalothece natronophila]QDZ40702.1 hypothetical protein FRE64_12515 [Euhalothece natronophila Z-M001]
MNKLITLPSLAILVWANLATTVTAQPLDSTEICDLQVAEGFQPGFQIRTQEEEIVSSITPSQTQMTIPSLWWPTQQLNSLYGNLINYWQANRQTRVIDIIVSNRGWRRLNYVERYSLVNKFGSVARGYHYNLAIMNQQQDCLAVYTCDWEETSPKCELQFDSRRN